ncbi:MAG: deoxyribodipyrimidine photo-lyase, partial [Burkholderiales bacterium]|nr:deoxyribodipyrimidine photo-lyase [Burkholderiales bacterium]
MGSSLIWFKRDLRLHDHAAVHAAGLHSPGQPLRGLYIVEPGLWAQPDAAAQHLGFLQECLADLSRALAAVGGELIVRQGEAVAVLARLHAEAPFDAVFAHEETGNAFTYQRDLAVAAWCRQRGVGFQEWPQFGVVRRLANRDHWQRRWQAHMRQDRWPDAPQPPRSPAHRGEGPTLPSDPWPVAESLGLSPQQPPKRQRGGRTRAIAVLDDFLFDRCGQYRGGISSPLSAPTACSRLSPHLALGCLSLREVVQATAARMADLRAAVDATADPVSARQHAGLKSFLSRLHWHCHFIQKLESEPELEWRNLHRGYDGLREADFNEAHFEALRQGRTGWPLVDACVAMLRETGWVNFRMRAMLVSVASYPLWLHWRPVGEWLATQFLDYEPGIHWSQLQMQAGTTGINTTRVYNPIKQARDHDPQGHFVRRWLPAMRRVPEAWLFEPWLMPADVQARCGLRVGPDAEADIPQPQVDLAVATREAKARLH